MHIVQLLVKIVQDACKLIELLIKIAFLGRWVLHSLIFSLFLWGLTWRLVYALRRLILLLIWLLGLLLLVFSLF